ncbi:MAG TPA: DMT family transporter [Anaerolineales bacterium]|nr:DMT family transporter [Anaerolineales bacterium]
MNSTFLAAAFALGAAACWGAGDFSGGLATRRSDSFRSVLFIYGIGLVALLIVAGITHDPLPPLADFAWGAVAGLFGLVGILLLFQAFAAGRMGIAAPVSGVLATALPVVFNAFTQGLPTSVQLIGFGVALVGIWLLSRPERFGGRPAGLGLAILAGLCFGSFFITLDQVGKASTFWPLIAGRAASCAAMLLFALFTRRALPVSGLPWRLFVSAGILDVGGNVFFLLALQNGRLDVAAVLGSLYPAVTAVLARLTIKEVLTRLQLAGVTAAMLAIVLITLPTT